jgi:hypothetical protein
VYLISRFFLKKVKHITNYILASGDVYTARTVCVLIINRTCGTCKYGRPRVAIKYGGPTGPRLCSNLQVASLMHHSFMHAWSPPPSCSIAHEVLNNLLNFNLCTLPPLVL